MLTQLKRADNNKFKEKAIAQRLEAYIETRQNIKTQEMGQNVKSIQNIASNNAVQQQTQKTNAPSLSDNVTP
jgi:hypothetical protein